jgi:hypothetical protein
MPPFTDMPLLTELNVAIKIIKPRQGRNVCKRKYKIIKVGPERDLYGIACNSVIKLFRTSVKSTRFSSWIGSTGGASTFKGSTGEPFL